MPDTTKAVGAGPFISQLDTMNADNTKSITKIYSGTATLASGTVTVTFPNASVMDSATSYVVLANVHQTSLITTADNIQITTRTTTGFTAKCTTSTSAFASAVFGWVAIGS